MLTKSLLACYAIVLKTEPNHDLLSPENDILLRAFLIPGCSECSGSSFVEHYSLWRTHIMSEKKKNPVDPAGLGRMRAEKLETRHKNILDSIERMDAAAEKKTEDFPTFHRAKTNDILWTLKKHKYEGWK